jgi:hypothetical protein
MRAPGLVSLHKSKPKLAAEDIIANMSTLELSDEQVISLAGGACSSMSAASMSVVWGDRGRRETGV